MLVRTWMSTDPITISPKASMHDATKLMHEHEIRHLPVVKGDKLVGIVTLSDIRKASPSPATTLSVGEVRYLVDQIMVGDIMTKDPQTVSPDTTVEDAALKGYKHGFGSLPVVENGRLVGIITQADLLQVMMNIFEAGEGDKRITIEGMPRELGAVRKIVDVLDEHQTRFSSILVFPQKQEGLYTYLIRVRTDDVAPVVADLRAGGFPVTHTS